MATSAPEKGDTVKDDYTNGNTTVVIDDPLSWPNWKKFYHTAIASFSHSSCTSTVVPYIKDEIAHVVTEQLPRPFTFLLFQAFNQNSMSLRQFPCLHTRSTPLGKH